MASTSREIALWTVSAVAVLAAHAGIVGAFAKWSDASESGGAASAILVEMAPIATEAAAEHANLPIAPPQEVQTEPEPKPEQQTEEKIEPEPEQEPEQKLAELKPVVEPPPPLPPTPPVAAEITLPPEVKEEKKPPPPKKKVAIQTAPERADKVAPRQRSQAGSASISPNVMHSYAANVLRPHIMRHISSARLHGIVTVTFTTTRQGRLTSRHVSRSSGQSELDSAALATLQRAQPFPPPPPELGTQSTFNFSVPLRYN
jgi:protein TonB